MPEFAFMYIFLCGKNTVSLMCALCVEGVGDVLGEPDFGASTGAIRKETIYKFMIA